MIKKRIGQSFDIRWPVKTEGVKLSDLDLMLQRNEPLKKVLNIPFHIEEDNILVFRHEGKEQKQCGIYTYTLYANYANNGQGVVDSCDGVELVSSSCQAEGDDNSISVDDVVTLQSLAMVIGLDGKSAYQVAVDNGFVGTEQEWLASLKGAKGDPLTYDDLTPEQIAQLKKPATDAAKEVEATNEAIKRAEQQRVTEFAALKEGSETATKNANDAAKKAEDAATTIDEKLAKKQDNLVSGKNIRTINGESILGSGNIVINPTIMDLKFTGNEQTTRKLVPIELREKGVKIAYTNSSKVYIVEQYQIDAVDDTNWANNTNWKACRTPMTPIFERAGASFNDETGFYSLNGLDDITEYQMMTIYLYANCKDKMNCNGIGIRGRTNIVAQYSSESGYTHMIINNFFAYNPEVEVVLVSYLNAVSVSSPMFCFNDSPKLRKVSRSATSHSNYGDVRTGITADSRYLITFNGCPKMEEVNVSNLTVSQSFCKDSPYINYNSVKFLIDKAQNKDKAITVTVHPTTYSYLMGTAEPTEQVGGTKEEWQAIVTSATEKNISFATTE